MEGQNLTGGDTDRGYNLRSQGPATLGVEALDSLLNPNPPYKLGAYENLD